MSEYCAGAASIGDEPFGCLEQEGHDGTHTADIFHGDQGCPSCGGHGQHQDDCPTKDLTEDETLPLYQVEWSESETEAKLVLWQRSSSKRPCPHCLGTGKAK